MMKKMRSKGEPREVGAETTEKAPDVFVHPTAVVDENNRRGATIGANAAIACGLSLGRFCFIGAGAVVTGNVPDRALVVGNPAVRSGWVCECGERLSDELFCPECGARYEPDADAISRLEHKPASAFALSSSGLEYASVLDTQHLFG
jgi:hypothetical protein